MELFRRIISRILTIIETYCWKNRMAAKLLEKTFQFLKYICPHGQSIVPYTIIIIIPYIPENEIPNKSASVQLYVIRHSTLNLAKTLFQIDICALCIVPHIHITG